MPIVKGLNSIHLLYLGLYAKMIWLLNHSSIKMNGISLEDSTFCSINKLLHELLLLIFNLQLLNMLVCSLLLRLSTVYYRLRSWKDMIATARGSNWIGLNQVLRRQHQRRDPLWIKALRHRVIVLEDHLKTVSDQLIIWLVLILQTH